MASEIFLYWGSGSSPCWRVMITLEEKGLSGYRNKLLSFDEREHKSQEVMEINPRGQVPTMKHGDVIVNDSIAAVLYLEAAFKGQGTELIPSALAKQARVLQRITEVNPLMEKMRAVMYYFVRNENNISQDKFKQHKAELRAEIQLWEGYLRQLGGNTFITGKDFTLADCCLFPLVAVLVRQGMDLEKHAPNLARYYNTLKERPSIQASWPPHYKVSPNQDAFTDLY
ncbi:glutathione S-transferase A-like [Ptychodera flava]|uniref:glutathione S-transferase A-like n=1 Tax=Ptychodera flava TaxID=63121 RepID=UPI00396A8544